MTIINETRHNTLTTAEIARALRAANYGEDWNGRTTHRLHIVINHARNFFQAFGDAVPAILARYRNGGFIWEITAANNTIRIIQRH